MNTKGNGKTAVARRTVVSVIAVLLVVVVAVDSFYTIDEAEQGVLTHFGKI